MNVIHNREDRNRNDPDGLGPAILEMDKFTYNYYSLNGQESNRLDYVSDAISVSPYTKGIKHGQIADNYEYNDIGQLTKDVSENMELERHLGDKKLKHIRRTDQDSPNLEFIYKPLGVRVAKISKPRTGCILSPQEDWTVYYYAYDANGQLMATYNSSLYNNSSSEKTTLEEQFIYGSSRIGDLKANKIIYSNAMPAEPIDPNPQPVKNIINNELVL